MAPEQCCTNYKEAYWLDDISVLWRHWHCVIPNREMTMDTRHNTLIRLTIMIALLCALYTRSIRPFIFVGIAMLLSLLIRKQHCRVVYLPSDKDDKGDKEQNKSGPKEEKEESDEIPADLELDENQVPEVTERSPPTTQKQTEAKRDQQQEKESVPTVRGKNGLFGVAPRRGAQGIRSGPSVRYTTKNQEEEESDPIYSTKVFEMPVLPTLTLQKRPEEIIQKGRSIDVEKVRKPLRKPEENRAEFIDFLKAPIHL